MRAVLFRVFAVVMLVCGLALSSSPSAKAADTFLAGHEDLPLLAGLIQDSSSMTVFDTPQGRIIETYAQTESTAQKVFQAYAAALPQLGWEKVGKGHFTRGAETLRFEVISPVKTGTKKVETAQTVIRIQLTSD